jgi:1,4-dihydroxy-2-naphthoate polyprenyltransferase
MSISIPIRPNSPAAWAIAVRPKTLWIATVPVIVSAALVWSRGVALDPILLALTLSGSILMQVITNLQNDVGYTVRRMETGQRIGLPRATANGWLSVPRVRGAIVVAIALATLVGMPLVARSGTPVLLLGLASIAAALSYMGGPRPIAYTPFGEITVFLFFGLAAVCGSHFVFTGTVGATGWLAAAAVGAHAAAVLAVNNYRDAEHDARTGRNTFAASFGRGPARAMYSLLILAPFVLVAAMAWVASDPLLLAPFATLPWAVRLRHRFSTTPPGAAFTAIMFGTVMLEVAFGMLLAAGAVAGRLAGFA